MRAQIELTRGYLQPLLAQPNIEIREHVANRYNSILRFDDQMLLTLHLWGTPSTHAPLLHLRRNHDDGMFDQFAQHYDAIWREAAEPIEPDPDDNPQLPGQAPQQSEPQGPDWA